MSNEKNNHDLNQHLDSRRKPYFQKDNTTDMTENTYDPGFTLKSSNQALDSQNNYQKEYLSKSDSMEGECIGNINESVNKNNDLKTQNEISNNANDSYQRNFNNEDYNERLEEPLYIMTLELERGKSEKLKIYPNSDPLTLAIEFCQVNNLDEDAVKYLASEIENLMNKNKFNNGDEINVTNENLDNTQEEFNENFNGNIHYDYGHSNNGSRYSNDSENNYKYQNDEDIQNLYNNYPVDDINSDISNKRKKNSHENFYNNPELVNHNDDDNVPLNNNNNSTRKNYLSENIPYLVHEQITEVDEENNVTIEKLKSSKTEIDNSRSPIEKGSDNNEIYEEKNNQNNSHLINKVAKDEEFNHNFLTSSGKSINKECNETSNNSRNKLSENENINRSQENIIEKKSINNINSRSNYIYFKNYPNEKIENESINEKGRIKPNDNKYSDSQIFVKDNVQKEFDIIDNQSSLNQKENYKQNQVKDNNSNSNNEEKFFTFKVMNNSGKGQVVILNNNLNSNFESSDTNKNFTFKENSIKNQDFSNENLDYDYNTNLSSDLNKTIKKNKNDLSNKNIYHHNNFDYKGKELPVKFQTNKSDFREINNIPLISSNDKLYFIADNSNQDEKNKNTKVQEKDIENPNNVSNRLINNSNNIKIKDHYSEKKEYPNNQFNKNPQNIDKNSQYDYKNQNGNGRNSQNSNISSIKRPNSKSKYQPLAERINNTDNNSISNSKVFPNNSSNSVGFHGYNSYSNINNKILNYQENENKAGNEENFNNQICEEQNIIQGKNVAEKIIINRNNSGNLKNQRNFSNREIKNEIVNSNNINNFINSIESEITSIKGTQSSNNDRYDKDTKDKSDLNNLNNLNNLIKVNHDKRNDVSDIILNNNINTNNTNNNVLNTKTNNSNINENCENNYNPKYNDEISGAITKNIVNRKSEDGQDDIIKRENTNKKVYFSDVENINKDQYYDKNNTRNIINYIYEDKKNPNKLSINSTNEEQIIENNTNNIGRKNENNSNPPNIYNKDRIVSIQGHKCMQKKSNFKNLNIFDRLYKEAEIKRVVPKNLLKEDFSNLSKNKIQGNSYINFGQILYAREKLSKEEKDKKLMQIKYEQDINQMRNLTFTPEVHEYKVFN